MNDLEELFFIYDLDAMQSEYDTLEGSLLYHHPKSVRVVYYTDYDDYFKILL